MLTTILIFFVILVILIISHELGHFLFAKWNGIKVDEFGLGFPPKLFGIKYGETLYSFNLLPLGGFVRIEGEDVKEGEEPGPRSFASKSKSVRSIVLIAGVVFNLILAFFLFSFGLWAGAPMSLDDDEENGTANIVVLEVLDNSPAELAGLEAGDIIVGFSKDDDEILITKVGEVQSFVDKYKGEEIGITYKREGEEFFTSTVLRMSVEEGDGILGIAMARIGIKSMPLHMAIWEGAKTTGLYTVAIFEGIIKFFGGFFGGESTLKQVAGPVGIANIVGNAASFGFLYLIQLTAILSVNLAVLNIIPFPGLDGGRLLFIGIEAIKGSPVSARVSGWVHAGGFVLLILLMVAITYNDIARFF